MVASLEIKYLITKTQEDGTIMVPSHKKIQLLQTVCGTKYINMLIISSTQNQT